MQFEIYVSLLRLHSCTTHYMHFQNVSSPVLNTAIFSHSYQRINVPSVQKGAAHAIFKTAAPTEHINVYFNNYCKRAQSRRLQLAALKLRERITQVCLAKRYYQLTCSNYNKPNMMSVHTLEIIIVFLSPEQLSSIELGHFVIQ